MKQSLVPFNVVVGKTSRNKKLKQSSQQLHIYQSVCLVDTGILSSTCMISAI